MYLRESKPIPTLKAFCLLFCLLGPLASCAEEDSGSTTNTQLCNNSCEYANDGYCDDGGENSQYNECALGSDCSDCGPRSPDDNGNQPPITGTLLVENESTTRRILYVTAGPCGGSQFIVHDETIRAGDSDAISLPPGCYDATAVGGGGSHAQVGIIINANSTTSQYFALD